MRDRRTKKPWFKEVKLVPRNVQLHLIGVSNNCFKLFKYTLCHQNNKAKIKSDVGQVARYLSNIKNSNKLYSTRKLFLIGEEATLPFILIGKKYI
jgi:hypothetical protein